MSLIAVAVGTEIVSVVGNVDSGIEKWGWRPQAAPCDGYTITADGCVTGEVRVVTADGRVLTFQLPVSKPMLGDPQPDPPIIPDTPAAPPQLPPPTTLTVVPEPTYKFSDLLLFLVLVAAAVWREKCRD